MQTLWVVCVLLAAGAGVLARYHTMRILWVVCVLLGASITVFHRRPSSDPDLILVVGQNDNLTAPAATYGQPAIDLMKSIQGWSDDQVYAFWTEARTHASTQFGINFTDSTVSNPLGFPNSPLFSLSAGTNAYMIPLVARGRYRVYGAIGDNRNAVVRLLKSNDDDDDDDDDDNNNNHHRGVHNDQESYTPVDLVEFVVLFDLSTVPNFSWWTFVPFNYGGVFATQNIVPSPVAKSDNLPLGIYRILGENFYMRTPTPDKTAPLSLGTSLEAAQLCSTAIGPGLSAMRVDAFAPTANSQGLYPTSTTAVWHFYANASRAAFPQLYAFAPKVYAGRTTASCLATV